MMSRDFPDRAWWAAHVIAPHDERKFGNATFHGYYRAKYQIARDAAPTSILEIGVRYGYSAWAFLCAAPQASYTGIDEQAGHHGGVKGVDTFDHVDRLLARDYPEAAVRLIKSDTQQLATLGGPFDLIHVDGDHSEAGCYHDLELALAATAPGGTIVVDDYDYIAGVRRAVDRFAGAYRGRVADVRTIATLRGDAVFTMRGAA